MNKIQNIPDGWEVKKLGECFKLSSGDYKPKDASDIGPFPIYGGNGIMGYSNNFNYSGDNIIIGRVGEYCGCVHRVIGQCWITDNALYIKDKLCNYSNDFMEYLLKYKDLSRLRNKGGQPLISQQPIYIEKTIIPPLNEQKRIAEVLGCWDEGIERLEKIISLKEQQKKGLMQRLLTGKTRLPGFTQPWEEVKLGNLHDKGYINIEKGKPLVSENIQDGEIPVIAGGQSVPYYHNQCTHRMLCTTVSASGAYAGYVWFHNTPIWASDCNVVYGSSNYDSLFLYFVLKNKQDEIYRLQTGGAQPHVYAADLKIIHIPNISIKEQYAIAAVLSEADNEITKLKQKLELFKQQKKWLMQQLLTGKKRLKIEKEN